MRRTRGPAKPRVTSGSGMAMGPGDAMRLRSLVRRAAALVAIILVSAAARAETLVVFAAASLHEALDAAVKPWEAASGNRVSVSYAASNALARQIEAGAPASIFISADRAWADYVEKRGLAKAGTRRDLLGNDLVLIAPAASTTRVAIAPGFDLAAALGGGRLALADPASVPAGIYAKAALVSLHAWDAVRNRIAPAENVRAALALVSRGEAPLGIVYRTDAIADKGVRVVATFPAASHPPVVYPLVELEGADAAADSLAKALASPQTKRIWEHYGFRAIP
ncbi:MAG TPA: molybdate ABC transporter substrate-binding protein [Usitatibacter sp.]|nr:molybdate ABC transporter substrate-binding protein [Usitatibacter sp.]